LELEKWLARMEQRTERMGTIATTADILEAQQKEQKVWGSLNLDISCINFHFRFP